MIGYRRPSLVARARRLRQPVQSVAGTATDEAAPRESASPGQVVVLIGYAQRVAGLRADEQAA